MNVFPWKVLSVNLKKWATFGSEGAKETGELGSVKFVYQKQDKFGEVFPPKTENIS